LSGHHFTDASDSRTPYRLCRKEAFPTLVPRKTEVTRSHEVEFYSDDAAFVVGFTYFIEADLKAGNAVIVVATESHRKSLLQRLQEHGVDIAAAIEQGRYLPLDVADTLSTFMRDDLPNPVRFFGVVGDLIAAAARATAGKQSRVAICGECASILWAQGNADAAIQVEQLCNQVTKRYEMDILCGFSLSSFYREEDKQVFQRICSEN
jgi:KaiC/GvpD/RAD55 family RecA-like ATPase